MVFVILIVAFELSLSWELRPYLISCLPLYDRKSLVFPPSIYKLLFEVFGSLCFISADSYSLYFLLSMMQPDCHCRVVTGQFASGHQSMSRGCCSLLLYGIYFSISVQQHQCQCCALLLAEHVLSLLID